MENLGGVSCLDELKGGCVGTCEYGRKVYVYGGGGVSQGEVCGLLGEKDTLRMYGYHYRGRVVWVESRRGQRIPKESWRVGSNSLRARRG